MDAEVDVAVVGGGVVGCAVASALARTNRSVLLLEGGPRLGDGVTSRNSGVIHSGLYYPPQSLKARACVRGNALLYEWAAARGVPHARPGKLVIARDAADVPDLEALEANARASEAPGVELVPAAFVRAREPAVPAAAALWCPRTGIVDAVELTRSLAADATEHGALVLTQARVRAIARRGPAYELDTARGPVRAERVVNAAGLHADEVAALAGVNRYQVHPVWGLTGLVGPVVGVHGIDVVEDAPLMLVFRLRRLVASRRVFRVDSLQGNKAHSADRAVSRFFRDVGRVHGAAVLLCLRRWHRHWLRVLSRCDPIATTGQHRRKQESEDKVLHFCASPWFNPFFAPGPSRG